MWPGPALTLANKVSAKQRVPQTESGCQSSQPVLVWGCAGGGSPQRSWEHQAWLVRTASGGRAFSPAWQGPGEAEPWPPRSLALAWSRCPERPAENASGLPGRLQLPPGTCPSARAAMAERGCHPPGPRRCPELGLGARMLRLTGCNPRRAVSTNDQLKVRHSLSSENVLWEVQRGGRSGAGGWAHGECCRDRG